MLNRVVVLDPGEGEGWREKEEMQVPAIIVTT
jgi:hypothetical protein